MGALKQAAPMWWQQRLCAFDIETTGVDVFSDRIVSASVIRCGGGEPTTTKTWLINPGVEIPEGASKIHGITTERAQAEGVDPLSALVDISDELANAVLDRQTLVVCNAPFDLTMLRSELHRLHLVFLLDDAAVIDPLVLDKHIDRYRKGSRRLDALAQVYSAKLDRAHDSASDAITAARVAYRIGERNPEIGAMSIADLQRLQRDAYREQANGLNDYWISKGDPRRVDNYEWPIRSGK